MNVARIVAVIRREKLSKSTNEAPVCLRIIKDRKVMYKTLFHVSPEFWDDKNRCIKKQHPNAEILNTTINQKKAELEKETLLLTLADSSISMETIRNKINNRTSFDLFEYANKYIEQLWGIERSGFFNGRENGRKVLKTKGFRHDRENGLNISKRFFSLHGLHLLYV